MKNQLLILGFLLTFLIAQGSAVTTLSGLSPEDNDYTSDQTPEFCAIPITTETAVNSSTLYIGGVPYGTETTLTNNTEFCITANATVPYGAQTWNFNVSAQDDRNQSTTYTLNVARLGYTTPIVEEVATGTIPAVASMVIMAVIVIVILAIVSFLIGLLSSITGKVKGKVKIR